MFWKVLILKIKINIQHKIDEFEKSFASIFFKNYSVVERNEVNKFYVQL